jgi:hypothetical protein
MSTFNPFAPRHIGSALSVGGLAALMIAGPLRPDIVVLSCACLLGSLASFGAHACFGRRPRPSKARKPRPPARVTPEWEDAESWEIPPTRDARRSWDAAQLLAANSWKMPLAPVAAPLPPAQAPYLGRPQAGDPPEPSRTEHRQALADMQGRRHAAHGH